jgi:hypothetical protein
MCTYTPPLFFIHFELFNEKEKRKERRIERQKGKRSLLWNNSRTTKHPLWDKPVYNYDLNISDVNI